MTGRDSQLPLAGGRRGALDLGTPTPADYVHSRTHGRGVVAPGVNWTTFLALAALCSTVPLAFYQAPVLYGRLVIEDSWGESAGFIALLVAGAVFLRMSVIPGLGRRRLWFAALGLGSLLLGFEEISWGQRFLGLSTPDFFLRFNTQGEMGFHNGTSSLGELYGPATLCVALYGALLPLVVAYHAGARSWFERLGLPIPSLSLMPLFLAPAIAWHFSPFSRPAELGGLSTRLALLGMSVEKALERLVPPTRPRNGALTTSAVLLAMLLCFGSGMRLSGAGAAALPFERTLVFHAGHDLPARGFPMQAEILFDQLESLVAPRDRSRLWLARAEFCEEQGRAEEAKRWLQRAMEHELEVLEVDPENLSSLRTAAEAADALGDTLTRDALVARGVAIIDHTLVTRIGQAPDGTSGQGAGSSLRSRIWSPETRATDRRARLWIQRADLNLLSRACTAAAEDLAAAESDARWTTTYERVQSGRDDLENVCPAH